MTFLDFVDRHAGGLAVLFVILLLCLPTILSAIRGCK